MEEDKELQCRHGLPSCLGSSSAPSGDMMVHRGEIVADGRSSQRRVADGEDKGGSRGKEAHNKHPDLTAPEFPADASRQTVAGDVRKRTICIQRSDRLFSTVR